MDLQFNKQYRQEKKLFNELAKKVVKSKKIELKYEGFVKVFQLESIDIYYAFRDGFKVKVLDKNGCVVVPEMYCQPVPGNGLEQQLQYERHVMFHDLLYLAGSFHHQRLVQAQKQASEEKKRQEQQARLDKAVADKIAAEMTIKQSLQRLKSL